MSAGLANSIPPRGQGRPRSALIRQIPANPGKIGKGLASPAAAVSKAGKVCHSPPVAYAMKPIVAGLLACLPPATPLLAQVAWDTGSPSTSLPATAIGTVTDFQQGPGILGGERDTVVVTTQTSGPVEVFAYAFPGRSAPLSVLLGTVQGSGEKATCTWIWDGQDASETINFSGLGGVDLAANYSGVEFDLNADSVPLAWTLQFYTSASDFSTYTVVSDSGSAVSGQHFRIPFSDFLATGVGADFSRIGAIVITSEGGAGMDTELDNLRFTPVPEPSRSAWATGLALVAWRTARRRRPAGSA